MTQDKSVKQAVMRAEGELDPVWAAAQALVEDCAPASLAQAQIPQLKEIYHWVHELGKFITRLEWDQYDREYQKEVASRVEAFCRMFSKMPPDLKMACLVSLEGLHAEQPSLTAVLQKSDRTRELFQGMIEGASKHLIWTPEKASTTVFCLMNRLLTMTIPSPAQTSSERGESDPSSDRPSSAFDFLLFGDSSFKLESTCTANFRALGLPSNNGSSTTLPTGKSGKDQSSKGSQPKWCPCVASFPQGS
jgi:hypothetical protein